MYGYTFKIRNNKQVKEKKKSERKKEYDSYLRSKEWRVFRELILMERGNYCEYCDEWFESLDIHHIHYKNFKKELREDVLVLCRCCHSKMHDRVKNPPYSLDRMI